MAPAHPEDSLDHDSRYVLPAIPVRQPLMLHPDYGDTAPAVHDWIRPYLLDCFEERPEDAPRTDGYLKQAHTYWGAACFPHTLPERFFAQQAWMIWATLVDDAFSAPDVRDDTAARIRLAGALCTAIDGAPGSGSAVERLVRAGQELLVPRTFVSVRMDTRAKQVVAQQALRPATASDDAGGARADFDSYLDARGVDVFGHWLMELVQWSLGIDLGDATDEDDDLRTACRRVMDHWILVNDLYSFPKEREAGETRNGVRVLMATEDLTLQQALDRLAARATEAEDAFAAARDAVLQGPLGERPDIRVFVRELGHMISGNLRYHRWTSRYFGTARDLPDEAPGTTRSEGTSLYERGTVHRPPGDDW
ncbi:terpene synthase family protein [Streptomyces sp. NPDC004126]|uniref:terpene synthase family protein n=1 Tax=Streptomyces sp. NPDC004126 TaxID=3390695 RepID=UPI003CFEE6F2